MALTKAQVSLVTVATLGAAPGGFTADLLNFGSQVEVAALALSVSPTQAAQTNAEFALQVAKNLGATDALSLYKALEAGTSRADAVVDFANAQLVAQGGNIAKVKAAEASNSTSTDLTELVAVVTPKATAATDATIIEFKDNNTSAKPGATNDTSGAAVATKQTIAYIGKDQIINGKATKVAADFTFQLKDQIGEEDTFTGQFLSPILDRKPADNTGSQVILELRNLREAVDSVEPLKSLPTNGIAFTLNGALLKIADQGTNKAIDNALTYDDLRTAIENRLAELARGENLPDGASGESTDPAAYAQLASFTVEKGGLFTAQNEKGDSVTGNQIVLTDKAGATLEPLAFTQSSDIIVGSGYTLYGELRNEDAKPITKLITTNLDADNVGYGSQGASVNIAGQSNSDKGVEELLVQAKNGVWFTKLESESKAGTDHLQKITLKAGSEGYFRVGTQENSLNHVVSLVDQDFSKGGLVDVQQVEAGNVAGSTAINSFVSKDVLARYTLKDTGKFDADESEISYNLSSGADVLNLAISTDVLEAVDTKVSVNTGAGNDVITVQATTGLQLGGPDAGKINAVEQVTSANAGWLVNQQLNNNIVINAGDGDDWILTPGAGNATINAGTGNDVVRVDNAGDRGVFVFNNATTDIKKLSTNQDIVSNSDNRLSNGASDVAQTYNFFKAQVKVSFKGFESAFVTIDSTNYQTTTKQINQAVKAAVNNDPVLNKLLFAIDNEGNALAIESLIDGLLTTGDLVIDIIPPVAHNASENAAQKATREKAGNLMLASDDLTKADTALKVTAGTINVTAMNTAVSTAEVLYASEFGTFGAATPGAGATASLVTTSFNFTKAITVTIGGTEVLASATYADADALATAIQNLGNVTTATNSSGIISILFNPTANGAANPAIVVKAENVDASDANTGTAGVDNATGSTAVIDTTGFAFGAGTETTVNLGNGVTIAAATYTNAAALAAAIQGHADVATAADSSGTITITFVDNDATAIDPARPVSVSNVLVYENAGTAGGTGIPAPLVAGTASGAESDNVINLGSGQDVLTLGTGALSNDTIKIEGYGLGEKTIVNFTTGTVADTNGADLLDFSAYLTSVDATTKATLAKTVQATALSADNSVSIVDFNGAAKILNGNTVTFEGLTAANVKAMINNDATVAGDAYGALDINIVTSGTGSQTQNFVLLVHDDNNSVVGDNNEGTYKAFHVTSVDNSAKAADVKLIGTFDFGENATGASYLDGLVTSNLA